MPDRIEDGGIHVDFDWESNQGVLRGIDADDSAQIITMNRQETLSG